MICQVLSLQNVLAIEQLRSMIFHNFNFRNKTQYRNVSAEGIIIWVHSMSQMSLLVSRDAYLEGLSSIANLDFNFGLVIILITGELVSKE